MTRTISKAMMEKKAFINDILPFIKENINFYVSKEQLDDFRNFHIDNDIDNLEDGYRYVVSGYIHITESYYGEITGHKIVYSIDRFKKEHVLGDSIYADTIEERIIASNKELDGNIRLEHYSRYKKTQNCCRLCEMYNNSCKKFKNGKAHNSTKKHKTNVILYNNKKVAAIIETTKLNVDVVNEIISYL